MKRAGTRNMYFFLLGLTCFKTSTCEGGDEFARETTSLINYRYMIGFRANNRQRVIGAFCNFHVNSKQRETIEVRV